MQKSIEDAIEDAVAYGIGVVALRSYIYIPNCEIKKIAKEYATSITTKSSTTNKSDLKIRFEKDGQIIELSGNDYMKVTFLEGDEIKKEYYTPISIAEDIAKARLLNPDRVPLFSDEFRQWLHCKLFPTI